MYKKVLFPVIGLLLIFSCKKEENLTKTNRQGGNNTAFLLTGAGSDSIITKSTDLDIDYSKVTVNNGMLDFQSMSAFADVGHQLYKIDTAHYTDSITYDTLEDEPVLRAFEDDLNFQSLRRKHHQERSNLIKDDNFTPSTDPDTAIFASPMIKTFFNPDLEIKFGDSIFKFLDNKDHYCLQVTGSNKFQIVNQIENSEGDAQALADLVSKNSVSLKAAASGKKLMLTDCHADFSFNHKSGSTYSLINLSNSNVSGTPKYTWRVNGTVVSRASSPSNLTLNDGDKVCLGFSVQTGNQQTKCEDDICRTLQSGCNAGFDFELKGGSLEVNFTSKSTTQKGSITGYQWKFGDGSTTLSQHPSHTYQKEGTYKVCLEITTNRGCKSTYCTKIKVKDDCCENGDKRKKWFSLGENKKVKTKIWTRNVLGSYTAIGAKTKFFRDDGFIDIDLLGVKADYLNTDIDGYVWVEDKNGNRCGKKVHHQQFQPAVYDERSHKISTTILGPNHKSRRLELKSLGSRHWAKNNGNNLTKDLYIANNDLIDCFD